jgi:thiol-disulfide isomerase/thioredoxin
MKKLMLVLVATALCIGQAMAAPKTKKNAPPQGYSIDVTVIGAAPRTMITFARYNDSQTVALDSLPTDGDGKVVFKGEQSLKAGMYKLTVANANTYVDVFITDGAPQHFALSFDQTAGLPSLEVSGSPENAFFAECMHFIGERQQRAQALQERMQQYANDPDSAMAVQQQLQQISQEIQGKWAELQVLYKGSTLALFIQSVQEPNVPEPSLSPMETNRDSAMQAYYFNYYKEHFFDNVDFSDARILNMPFLNMTLRVYYLRILPLDKDILMERTRFLIEKAKANREVYEHIVRDRYDFFRSAPYPELGEIAPALAETYIVRDSANWDDKAFVARTLHFIQIAKLNPAGAPATNLNLQDSTGKVIALYDVEAPYTVLLFYNPQCHSCSAVTPVLWELYTQYRDKGLQVYAAYVDNLRSDWAPYLAEKQYNWINVWDPDGSEKLYDKYDIHAIPLLYLLDENKVIIRKDITVEDLRTVLPTLFN